MNLPVPEGRDTMSGDRSSDGRTAVLAITLLLVLAVATNGDIKVTVTDELGSALQGATVEVKCNVIGAAYSELSGSPKTGASGYVEGTAVAASKCTSDDDAEGGRIHVKITKDGHIRKTIEDGDTRWYPDVNPNSVTVSGIEYAYTITAVSSEGPGNVLTTTLSGLSVGDSTGVDACTLNSGTWYCPVTLANSDGTLVASPAKDGYVQENYNLNTQTNRADHDSVQATSTVSGVKFAYKITGVTTETLATDLTTSVSPLTVGDASGQDACTLSGSIWYCPVQVVNSNVASIVATPTLNGYVQKSYNIGTQTTRTANTAGQVTSVLQNVQYAFKIDTISTETLATNIAGSVTSLTVGDDTGQDSCTKSGSTWYCRVLTANSNSDANMRATPTLNGYVLKSYSLPTGNTRGSDTVLQKSPTVPDILYAYKITGISTETLVADIATAVSPLTVGDATAQDTCTRSGSTWFCPVETGNSNVAPIIATPTLDGYVKKSYNIGTQTTRTANTAGQVTSVLQNVQYGFKIDTISTETIGTNLAGTLTALTVGDNTGQDACTKSGSTWFCPIQTANSDSDANMRATPTLDGYVQKSYSLPGGNTRGSDTIVQRTPAVSNVQYAYKITGVTTETLATDLTTSVSPLTVGDASGQDACTLSGSTWFCPVQVLNSNAGSIVATPTLDGYVQKSYNIATQTTRTANTANQVSSTLLNVQYAFKIDTISTETLTINIAGSVTALTVGDASGQDSCTKSGSTWYCRVLTDNSNSDANMRATPTIDGYVQKSYSLPGGNSRGSNTIVQRTPAVSSVEYAFKIDTISTETLGANIVGSVTAFTVGDDTGQDACTKSGSTWFCPIQTANSDSDANMRATPTLDGYVQKSYTLPGGNTRSSDTVVQRTPAVSNVLYAYKITGISTETLVADITTTVSPLTVGDATGQDTCTRSGSTWFCPVQTANSNAGSIVATPTLNGYVQKSYDIGTQTTRTANTANQVSSTLLNVQYAFKIDTVTTETLAINIAGSATTLTVGDDTAQDSCTKSGSTWFCPVQTANSDSDANMRATPTLNGYVQKSYSIATGNTRGSNTVAQKTPTVPNVLYAYKITGISTETLAADITTAVSPLTVGDATAQDTCTRSGSNWYCRVLTANSNVAPIIATPTLDGYVQNSYNIGTQTTRTADTAGQVTSVLQNVQYAFKIDTISTETIGANIAGTLTTLTVGDNTGQDACTKSGSTWYCRVLTTNSDSDANMRATPTLDGYVQKSYSLSTGNTRSSNTIVQRTPAVSSVLYAYKVTSITTEGPPNAITSATTALTVGDDTGQESCTRSGTTWYCPITIANTNGALVATPTLEGYVQKSYGLTTASTRSSNDALQVSDTVAGVQFAYKITGVSSEGPTNDLTESLEALAVGDVSGTNACTLNGGAWYCVVVLANSDQTLIARPTKDGYVLASYNIGTPTTRDANTVAQVTSTVAGIKFAYKITDVTAEGPGTDLTGTLASLSLGDATGQSTCQLNSGAWYCPTILVNSDQTLVASPALDGYVQKSYDLTTGNTRAGHSTAQVVDTVAGVQYAFKIDTVTTETIGTNIASTITGLAVGDDSAQDSCTKSGSTWYCRVLITNSNSDANMRTIPTLDGYVQKSHPLPTGNARSTNTIAQRTPTVDDVLYAYKITGISTETIAADITTSVSPLTVGDASGQDTCTRSGSTWYCPVQTANSNAGSIIATPTLDGYVQKSYNIVTQTTRTANTANQVTSALQNVQYAYKITSVTAEGPGTGLTSSLTSLVIGDGSGQDACTLSSGDWYCSVRIAYSDQTPLFARPIKDGYVLANYNIGAQTTRSANTATQVATTVSDVRFAFTVTSVTTEGPGTALTSSITTMTVGDDTGKDACLLNGGAWYCPVLLANSDGTLKVRPVKDGYVEEDHTYTGAGTRTAYDAAQSTGTVADFRFSYTVQVEDQRTTAGSVTGATVTAGASDVGCTFSVDRYYCPIVLADDTGADADVDAAKAGYVTTHWDAALAAGRSQHTDGPLAVTVTDMPFAQKLVITTEAISAAFTGAAVTAGSGATACVEDDTIAGTYWCTVPSNQDNGSNDIAITKDGFVKHVTDDTVDRTDAGTTQGTVTIDDVKYAHKVTVTDELGITLTSGVTVTTGGSYGTTCVQSGTTNTFYCPIPLSDTDIAIKVEKDGYVTHTADSFAEDRDSETDAQGTKAVTTVRYAVKVSVDDAAAENNAVTGATVRTGDSLGVTCVEPGAPDSTYYCAVPLAHSATDVELAKDGYVTKSFASAWTDRTGAADAQLTVTGADLQHGFRLTVSNYTGTPLTENLTVSSGDGFGVTCDQDGSTNVFHCPVPLAHTGVRIKVVQNSEIIDKLHRFAVDRTAANDTQGFKAVIAGLVWYRVDVREEVGTLLPAATVSTGDSWGVVCSEPDTPNGTYYCPLAVNETNTDLRVQRSGYVTTVYTKALGNGTAPEAEWGEFNATGVKYTVRMVLHDTLNATIPLNGTADKSEVAAVSGTPAIKYYNGHAYIAATGNDTYRVTQAGYLTATSGTVTPGSVQVEVRFGHNGSGCTSNTTLSCQDALVHTLRFMFKGCKGLNSGGSVKVLNGTQVVAVATELFETGEYYAPLDPALDDNEALETGYDSYLFSNTISAEVNDSAQHTKSFDFAEMWGGCGGSSSSSSSSSSSTSSTSTSSGGAVSGGGGGGGGGMVTDTFEVTCPAVTVRAEGTTTLTCTFRQLEGAIAYLDGTADADGGITVDPLSFPVDRLHHYDPDLGDYSDVQEVVLTVSAAGLDRCTDAAASIVVNGTYDTRSGPQYNDTTVPVTVVSHDECHVCGDGACTGRESVDACPDDCATCGDGKCTGDEDLTSCSADCTQCGDGACTGDESLASCPSDCATCGDGSCDGGEDAASCPDDCATCGDGTCSLGESQAACCIDCGCPNGMTCDATLAGCMQSLACGDGSCDEGEDATSCPGDCTACGDGLCTGDETTESCCTDCGCTEGEACDADLDLCRAVDVCGDGTCGIDETGGSCPDDCAACGDGICSSGEDQINCCADCACATGECNVLLGRCEVPAVCGDGACDAGEALTCTDDCATCGDGTCSDGEDCCLDCGCFGDEVCDQLTVSCVIVEKENTFSFRHEAVPGTGTGTGEGATTPPEAAVEKEIEEVRQSVADVAALVTRSRAAQSGGGTGSAVSAVQVKAMVERSVAATREVDVGRDVTVRETSDGIRSTVSVTVRKSGDSQKQRVRIVETIPKDVAGSVDQIAFDPPPDVVLKDDPVVGWDIDMLPGQEVTFTYTVARDISDVTTYQRPIVIVEEEKEKEAPPVTACGDGMCDAGESAGTCCDDCGCPDGGACSDGTCTPVETAAAGTPTSLILGAVLAIIIATSMVAVFTMRKREIVEVEEAVEELPIAQPALIAKPVEPAKIEEVPAAPVVFPRHAIAASAGLSAPPPHGLVEQLLMPKPAVAPIAAAAVKVEAPFSTPFEGLDVPEGKEDEVPLVPGHRPRIRRIDELTPEAAAEVAHGLPAPDILHNIASKVRQLRADALHVAMRERSEAVGTEEEVVWCSSFLRTYSLVDREWLQGILRMSGITEDVVEEAERRLMGIPSKEKDRGLGMAAAEVMPDEEQEQLIPEEDVLRQLVDHMDLRAEALHDAMHSDISPDTPYEERIKWIVRFLERYRSVEMDWLRYLLTMAGVEAEEVEEAMDRRSVDDEDEPGGTIVAL